MHEYSASSIFSVRVRWLAVHVAFAAALLCCSPAALAQADGTWKTPEQISGASHVTGFSLAGGTDGDVVATWVANDGGSYAVQAARRPAGTLTWSGVQTIATGANGYLPQVTVTAHGDAIVAWIESGTDLIKTSHSTRASDVWSVPTTLVSHCAGTVGQPVLTSSADGNAITIWQCWNYGVQAAQYEAATSTWSDGQDLSAGNGDVGSLHLAMNAKGDAVAVWRHAQSGVSQAEVASFDGATGTWSTAVDLGQVSNSDIAQPAIDPTGGITVAWGASAGTGQVKLRAARLPAGSGNWGEPVDVSGLLHNLLSANLVATATGDVIAVWGAYLVGDDAFAIYASRLSPATDTWTATPDVFVSASGDEAIIGESGMGLGVDAKGNARVVWTQGLYMASPSSIRSAQFVASTGLWQAPETVVASRASRGGDDYAGVVVAADGSAVAAWTDDANHLSASQFALTPTATSDNTGVELFKAATPRGIRWSGTAASSGGRVVAAPGRPVRATFRATPGTTYTITAQRSARALIRGTCAVAGTKVHCSIRLPHNGHWVVLITPRRNGVAGTPARMRVVVRAVRRPEPVTG